MFAIDTINVQYVDSRNKLKLLKAYLSEHKVIDNHDAERFIQINNMINKLGAELDDRVLNDRFVDDVALRIDDLYKEVMFVPSI